MNEATFTNTLIVAAVMAAAAAVLSVIVVLRRWSFIGEGISHAGFGGIGTAWLLSLAFPALASPTAAYAVAVIFCLATALCIGHLSRGKGLAADAVIGISLVASLAWGFLALAIYQQSHPAGAPDWQRYLFGDIAFTTRPAMYAAVALCAAVLLVVFALHKEILAYAFDPLIARVAGVPTGFIHYLLMLLLALVIVIGMRVAGNVLVTALLILPGATALLLGRSLTAVICTSICVALIGALGGLLASHHFWPRLPGGPCIVLTLFLEFLLAYAISRLQQRTTDH